MYIPAITHDSNHTRRNAGNQTNYMIEGAIRFRRYYRLKCPSRWLTNAVFRRHESNIG